MIQLDFRCRSQIKKSDYVSLYSWNPSPTPLKNLDSATLLTRSC